MILSIAFMLMDAVGVLSSALSLIGGGSYGAPIAMMAGSLVFMILPVLGLYWSLPYDEQLAAAPSPPPGAAYRPDPSAPPPMPPSEPSLERARVLLLVYVVIHIILLVLGACALLALLVLIGLAFWTCTKR